MLQNAFVSLLIVLVTGLFTLVFGQTAVKPVVVLGDVTAVGEKKFTVKAATGEIEVITTDATVYKRVSPENASLTAATAGTASEIGVGDRLTISALPDAEAKTLTARTVYYMTKADIAAKNAKEAEAWRVRGVTGKVVSVNKDTNQLVLETRTLVGSTNVTLTPKQGATFKRYAPDSIRYDEALSSSLAEIGPGDMIRALGDRSSDGMSFAAEQVVTGAFQTIAGTVKTVDAEKNEVVISDLVTKKDVTVFVGQTSVMKKFPEEQAEQMARMQMMAAGMGGGARPVGGPPQGGGRPAGPPQGGGQGQPGRVAMGGRGGGTVDEMLERFPTITAADLKAGDMIALSSSKNGANTRVKAIKLLAGVEPFLRMAAAGGGGRRGGGGVDGGFSIPGLDGIGFP